ncbi:uncharacterized protein K460DRAFT_419863 [Cucurbitaria berberidis CBS 394.84]|uniref:DUF7587 domain-containing protein n=1 Tax=Cucurbitaria berberidis CBS 394.84 TaxID=1168544 RepID=A0A9P4L5D6_9PLEO|nr:uncharacterized protein K460DRAFT_419863 [Cucurbitaria berberidis CBS 394.84]KAF1841868.1 hypothetical protein K460DRAFT_419863 [Cucurbitaria berberidis CBS 394.84]
MSDHAWQKTEASGVMLFMPLAGAEGHTTQQQLSRLSVCEDETQDTPNTECVRDEPLPSLPPLQGQLYSQFNIESEDEHLSDRSESSATLSIHSSDLVFSPDSSTLSTPSSSMNPFFEQLKMFANSSSGDETPNLSTSKSSLETDTDDYDSDRTDFLLTQKSPCPRRVQLPHQHRTATRGHFRSSKQAKVKNSVVRRLDFGRVSNNKIFKATKQHTQSSSKSASKTSLEKLREIEGKPRHPWCPDDKRLLLIIHRWFWATDYAEVTALFNHITGLDLDKRKLDAEFRDIKSYGSRGSHEWGQVFDEVSFEDPSGTYTEIRGKVDAAAKALQIDFQRREEEEDFNPGSAAKTSTKSRKRYKQRVRLVAQQKKAEATIGSSAEKISVRVPKLGGVPLVMQDCSGDIDILSDVEDEPIIYCEPVFKKPTAAFEPHIPPVPTKLPHLAFRVWDSSSRTKFTNEGSFIAESFMDAPSPLPAPIPPNDVYGLWKYFAARHLSKKGALPLFVSTAVSLLQVLRYATDMKRPMCAIIDLRAPCLQEFEYQMLHAYDVFPWLQTRGLTRWARYKGNGEYFVWAKVPKNAILHVFELQELWELAASSPTYTTLLCPDAFNLKLKTAALASAIRRKRQCFLDISIAGAMARIGVLFGMNKLNVTDQHVSEFVAQLLCALQIERHSASDIHSLSSIAASFAFALRHKKHSHQKIMSAFLDGVVQGTEATARFRPKSVKRRRSRIV